MLGSVQLATPMRMRAPPGDGSGATRSAAAPAVRASPVATPGSCIASMTAEQYPAPASSKNRGYRRRRTHMATYTFALSTSEEARQAGVIQSTSFDEALRL